MLEQKPSGPSICSTNTGSPAVVNLHLHPGHFLQEGLKQEEHRHVRSELGVGTFWRLQPADGRDIWSGFGTRITRHLDPFQHPDL